MYNSHKLPPPSSFAQESRSLRLTSLPAAPLPTGACRFILLNPSVENQECSCQSFHHNRSTPGSVCDCGHQACFHVHQPLPPLEGSSTNSHSQYSSSTALLSRIQRLEDALQQEHAIRETAIADERRAREREVRILREALHPFYKSEEEMKRKLIEVEDRIEATYDEQLRLKDRIVALDDANMALERRLEEVEGTRPKKRRTSRQIPNGITRDGTDSHSHDSALSSPLGQSLSLPNSSRAMSPTSHTLHAAEHDEPRSSGILNLVNLPEPPPVVPSPREPTPREEVRSSGFLEISLAERLAFKFATSPPRDFAATSPPIQAHAPIQTQPLYNPIITTGDNLPRVLSPQTNGATKLTSVTTAEVSPPEGTPKKRSWDGELRPLDVLANLSAASPMV